MRPGWGRNVVRFGVVAAVLALPGAVRAASNGEVPGGATFQVLPLKLDSSSSVPGLLANAAVEVALAGGSSDPSQPQVYYAFPSFALDQAELRYGAADFGPLLDLDGKVTASSGTDEPIQIKLHLIDPVHDPGLKPAVDAALGREPLLANRLRLEPEIRSQWSASLYVQGVPLGSVAFMYVQPQHDVWLTLDAVPYMDSAHTQRNPAYDLLAGAIDPTTGQRDLTSRAQAADLVLYLDGSYDSAFGQGDIQTAAACLDAKLQQALSRITTGAQTPDGQLADLFVAVTPPPGSTPHTFDFVRDYRAAVQAGLGHGDTCGADPALVHQLLGQPINLFTPVAVAPISSHDQAISFLLSNGLRATVSLGHLSDLDQFNQSATFEQTETQLDQLATSQHSLALAPSISLDGVGWGTDTDFASFWARIDQNTRLQVAGELVKEMGTAAQILKGEVPQVPVISLEAAMVIGTRGYFQPLTAHQTAQVVPESFTWRVLFTDSRLVGQPLVSQEFASALAALVQASREQFVGYALGPAASDGTFLTSLTLPDGAAFLPPRLRLETVLPPREPAVWMMMTSPSADLNADSALYEQERGKVRAALQALSTDWAFAETSSPTTVRFEATEGTPGPRVEVALVNNAGAYTVTVSVYAPLFAGES